MTARDPDCDAGTKQSRAMTLIPTDHEPIRSNRIAQIGGSVVLLLAIWVVWKFGGFDLMVTIEADGRRLTIANTFATVDHPFHATRGDTLLRSLQDGQLLRWIGHHQGGYPVEF